MSQAFLRETLDYLKSQSDDGRISFHRFVGFKVKLPFAVGASFVFEGEAIQAYGQAESKDKAAYLSVMELMERFLARRTYHNSYKSLCDSVFKKAKEVSEIEAIYPRSKNWLSNTSSGVSIHTDKRTARESAVNELIERHVLLKALATGTRPIKINRELNFGSTNYFLSEEMNCDFYAWRGPLGRSVVCVRVRCEGKAGYGFGCATDLESACEKAFYEVAPKAYLMGGVYSAGISNSDENMYFHWDQDTPWTDSFFQGSVEEIPEVDEELSKNHIWVSEKKIDIPSLRKKFYLTRAVSPLMQGYFKGDWEKSKLNFEALPNIKEMPIERHMIG